MSGNNGLHEKLMLQVGCFKSTLNQSKLLKKLDWAVSHSPEVEGKLLLLV